MEKRKISVEQYNPQWVVDFENEKMVLNDIFGDILTAIHHIGSTAVPATLAKPVIDILVVVTGIQAVDALNTYMEAAGYGARGKSGIPGRRYFRKGLPYHTHHVHVFTENDPNILRHLAFRDYLNTHPHDARRYGELKRKLAERDPYDIEGYISGKNELTSEIEAKALAWYTTGKSSNGTI